VPAEGALGAAEMAVSTVTNAYTQATQRTDAALPDKNKINKKKKH